MNDEIKQLKDRIAELERKNAELVRENAALKAKPQKETKQGSFDKGREILHYFFDNPQAMTASQVASRFSVTQSIAQYHIENLVTGGFLSVGRTSGNATGYVITPSGRAVILGAG